MSKSLLKKRTRKGQEILFVKPAFLTDIGARILGKTTYQILDRRNLNIRSGIFLKADDSMAIRDVEGIQLTPSYKNAALGLASGAADLTFRTGSKTKMTWRAVPNAEQIRNFINKLGDPDTTPEDIKKLLANQITTGKPKEKQPLTANYRGTAIARGTFENGISLNDAWQELTNMFNGSSKAPHLVYNSYPLEPLAVASDTNRPNRGDLYQYVTVHGSHSELSIDIVEPQKRLAYTERGVPKDSDKHPDDGRNAVSFDKVEFILTENNGRIGLEAKRYQEVHLGMIDKLTYSPANSLIASIGGKYKRNDQQLKLSLSDIEITIDNHYRPNF